MALNEEKEAAATEARLYLIIEKDPWRGCNGKIFSLFDLGHLVHGHITKIDFKTSLCCSVLYYDVCMQERNAHLLFTVDQVDKHIAYLIPLVDCFLLGRNKYSNIRSHPPMSVWVCQQTYSDSASLLWGEKKRKTRRPREKKTRQSLDALINGKAGTNENSSWSF